MGGCPWGIAGRWWFILSRQIELFSHALPQWEPCETLKRRNTGEERYTRLSCHSTFRSEKVNQTERSVGRLIEIAEARERDRN